MLVILLKKSPGRSRSQIYDFGRRATAILYRVFIMSAIVGALMSVCALTLAQQEMPEIKPQEGRFNQKKTQGPRAVALMQVAANGKATLVPIAIRIDGKFYDAAAYKANPVPMALESGTVYEAERSGRSMGLFTVSAALHSNSINAPTPWIGTGQWLPEGSQAPKSGRRAESVPVGIETSDAPPRLTKNTTEKSPAPASAPAAQTPPPKSSPETKTSTESKPNAPRTTPDASTPPKPDSAKQPEHSTASDSTRSSAGDGNRPRLRRGKPTEPLPDDDVPGYSKPGSPPPTTAKGSDASPSKSSPGTAATAVTQIVPAVSDADGPNPRSYAFEWIKGEEADRRKQLTDLASEQLRLYLAKQAKSSIPASPAGSKTASHKQTLKAPESVMDNVEMRAFDLWANNVPIMVLRAQAHVPASAAKNDSGSPPDSSAQYTITVVARTDIYDSLHKLYSAVTDKYHLDVTPRLELIDAVDADGDGRGELLFRETSDVGNGYVIYRATADTLWKMFDSLNPE